MGEKETNRKECNHKMNSDIAKVPDSNSYKFSFKATIGNEVIFPKGFYYQKKHIILVGNSITGDTIRRKEKISDVEIEIYEN